MMSSMTKQQALVHAKELTERHKRKYVVRDDYGKYFVCPLYLDGHEGYQHDAGYEALGRLVEESR